MSAPTEKRRFGNYEILSKLGRGGMAEVFRARVLTGPRAGWQVALKRLIPELASHPEYVALFAREAALSRLLDHPNIVKVLDVGELEGISYIEMDLVDGRDVGQILRACQKKGIPWPIDFAVYLTKVLLEALAYAHGLTGPGGAPLGIVHCDVSPSNLFVSRTGDIKLGDFGVARARAAHTSDVGLLGKPFYLSPEILDGTVNQTADLWAATVTLYELLTLRRPFQGQTPDEVFASIRARAYSPVRDRRPDVPDALAAVIERGFHLDPAARFQSAAEYAEALIPLFDERVGTPLAISAVVRGLFGPTSAR